MQLPRNYLLGQSRCCVRTDATPVCVSCLQTATRLQIGTQRVCRSSNNMRYARAKVHFPTRRSRPSAVSRQCVVRHAVTVTRLETSKCDLPFTFSRPIPIITQFGNAAQREVIRAKGTALIAANRGPFSKKIYAAEAWRCVRITAGLRPVPCSDDEIPVT